jgi:hypothetical protein
MAEKIPLTLDTFFEGRALDLVNFAADIGTERDRGQFGDSAYIGLDYGRDLMLLLERGFPSVSIRQEIERSPALASLGPTVNVEGSVGEVRSLQGDITLELEDLTVGIST